MSHEIFKMAKAHALEEFEIFKNILKSHDEDWSISLDSFFVKIRRSDGYDETRTHYAKMVRSFHVIILETKMQPHVIYRKLPVPRYMASAFGVRVVVPTYMPDKNERMIFEPRTLMRWPTSRMLGFELGVGDAAVYNHLKGGRHLKGRYFQHAIPRF